MRILFVAMADSVHTASWVSRLRGTDWDVHVFDMKCGTVGPQLEGVAAHTEYRARPEFVNVRRLRVTWPLLRGESFARRHLSSEQWDRLFGSRMDRLAKLIPRLKPDVIHSMEMQHESCPLAGVRERLGGFSAPWIYSSWGSDLYLYRHIPGRQDEIRAVLSMCDYYLPDCQRDIRLARELGFGGTILPVFPANGGFDLERMRAMRAPGPSSRRRVIAVKGYQGWAGRALVALRAVELCADQLGGYRVVVYMASSDVQLAAQRISRLTGLSIDLLPLHPERHESVLQLLGQARVAVGVGISDGSPIAMLEAMVMGSLPVQSYTSAASEWVEDGRSGLLVHPEDPEGVAEAIRRAVREDELVDEADALNARTADARLDGRVLGPRIVAMYEDVARGGVL